MASGGSLHELDEDGPRLPDRAVDDPLAAVPILEKGELHAGIHRSSVWRWVERALGPVPYGRKA
jgi:hypothetical protein